MANGESSSLQQSKRIANVTARGTALDKAQTVLMRKLGVITKQEEISPEAREAYTRLFEHTLSHSHLTALTALFGTNVLPDCEARSADFLRL